MDDWSELSRDVVELITCFLPLADIHRFSAVCQNWCFLTKEKRYHPVAQLPWLVLTDDESSGKRRIFNLSENKHYQFDIPELRGAYIVGSSFGWLFAVGPRLDAHLVNPFSSAKFSLPSLSIYHEKLRPEILVDHVERDENSYWPLNYCFELVQHILVVKAVLSADPSRCTDFVVFIMLAGDYRLAFYKSGDTTWTVFDYEDRIDDIVCFRGQFYALVGNKVLATIDIGPEPKVRLNEECVHPCHLAWSSYLVDYKGTDLLIVARLREMDKDYVNHDITTQFRVFKVDLERYNSYKLKDIDGHALFLGKNCGIVVRASGFNGCMPNSIYFTDSVLGYPKKEYGFDDMGVYNLEDGSVGHFYPPDIKHPPQSCPIWLVPNPW